MRKITENAVNAFFAGRNWASGNTIVQADGRQVSMFLHGNKIAWRYTEHSDEIRVNMCGWPTATTRERMNALTYEFAKVHVYQRNNTQYIGDVEAYDDETYVIFEDGCVTGVA